MLATTFFRLLMIVAVSAVRKAQVDGEIEQQAVHARIGEEEGTIYNCDQHKLDDVSTAVGFGYCWSTCNAIAGFRDCGADSDDTSKFSVAVKLLDTSAEGCSGFGSVNVRAKCLVTDHKKAGENAIGDIEEKMEHAHKRNMENLEKDSTEMITSVAEWMVSAIFNCDTHTEKGGGMSLSGSATGTGYCWSNCNSLPASRSCGEWKVGIKLDEYSHKGCSNVLNNYRVKCMVTDAKPAEDRQWSERLMPEE